MFPIKRTVFLCTVTLVKNTVRLIRNIEYSACSYPERTKQSSLSYLIATVYKLTSLFYFS